MLPLLLLCVTPLLAQPADPLQGLRSGHPRLIALDADIARVRELIKTGPEVRRLHGQLRAEADKLLDAPTVEYKLVGPRLLTQSRRCLERVYTLALLYRLEGAEKYKERALKELRAAAAFPDWNPSHFLDTAEMTHAFAIGYDWLYPALSDEDRAWLRRAILDKGIARALPLYREQRSWVKSKFNWNQVCNGGIGIGALAVADTDPDTAREVLRYATASLPLALGSYAPDGGWAEGPGYWDYATRYTVYLMAALETALGHDFGLSKAQGFDRAGHFRIHAAGPSRRTFNYADAHDGLGPSAVVFWLARRFSEPVYAWHERELLERRGPHPLDLVWFQTEAKSPTEAKWPAAAFFEGVQVACFRTSWDDEQAMYFAIKGGDNKANHSQLDLGTFVLDTGRTRWAVELGPDNYNLPQYFGKLRWTYYRMRTESHNTVLIDNENQKPEAAARVLAHSPAEVRFDLAAAYPQVRRLERRAAFDAAARTVRLTDIIEASQPVEALWGMVTAAAVEKQGARAALEQDGKRLSARVLSPKGAVFDIVSTEAPPPQARNEGTRKLVVRLPGKVNSCELVVELSDR